MASSRQPKSKPVAPTIAESPGMHDHAVPPAVEHRQRLEVIRDQLTEAMLECEPSVKAQVAGQLRQVLREIAELPAVEVKSARDRFSDRVSAANRPASSA